MSVFYSTRLDGSHELLPAVEARYLALLQDNKALSALQSAISVRTIEFVRDAIQIAEEEITLLKDHPLVILAPAILQVSMSLLVMSPPFYLYSRSATPVFCQFFVSR